MLDRYDFNEVFGPLRVYDQGAQDTCFYFQRAEVVAAKLKIHNGVDYTWSGVPGGAWKMVDGTYGWEVQVAGQAHQVFEDHTVNKGDHTAIKQALLDSGVLMLAIEVPESIKLFDQTKMPVIVAKTGDNHVSAHSLLGAGFTPDGLIAQSTWGERWGYKGRAIISWDWWDNFGINAVVPRVDSWPAKDMPDPLPSPQPVPPATIPVAPAPTPTPTTQGGKLLLIRRSTGTAVFAVTGGVRSWVKSRTVLERQGATMADVKVLPPNDILFTLDIVGSVPPEK